ARLPAAVNLTVPLLPCTEPASRLAQFPGPNNAILSPQVSFRRDSCSLTIELPPGAQVQDRTDCVRRIFYWVGPEIFSAYPVEIPALHAIDYMERDARYLLGNIYLIPRSVFYLHRMRLLAGGG